MRRRPAEVLPSATSSRSNRLDVDFLDAEFGQGMGNTEFLSQSENPVQYSGKIPTRQIQRAGNVWNLIGDGRFIADQHIRKNHAVGQAMMRVVARSDGMGYGVNRTQPFLERGRPHRGSGEHVGARLQI